MANVDITTLPITASDHDTDHVIAIVSGRVRRVPIADLRAALLEDISGLVTQGTNVTITGSGTALDPYVVNSAGGGGAVPGEIDEANIKNASSSTVGLITGRRFKAAFDEHLSNANIPGGNGAAQIVLGNVSGATPIDLDGAADTEVTATLMGNATISLSNVPAGKCVVTLYLLQDGTGGWELTHPGSTDFFSGQDGSINEDAGAVSVVTYVTLDGGTTWMVAVTDARGIDPGQGGITGNEPLRLFPDGDGSYYVTFTEAVELDLTNAVVAGTGDVDWELDSGDGFDQVAGKGNVYQFDVLKAIVSNFSGYLAIAIPQGAPGGDDLKPDDDFVETHHWVDGGNGSAPSVNGLTVTFPGGGYSDAFVKLDMPPSGKLYLEFKVTSAAMAGYSEVSVYNSVSDNVVVAIKGNGNLDPDARGNIGSLSSGSNVGVALNSSTKLIWVRHNGGDWNDSPSADPSTGVGGIATPAAGSRPIESIIELYAAMTTVGTIEAMLHASQYEYSAPAGFDEALEEAS